MNIVKCFEKEFVSNFKYGPRSNDPVNVDVIERVSKDRECYYPDNEGIPVIRFWREKNVFIFGCLNVMKKNCAIKFLKGLLMTKVTTKPKIHAAFWVLCKAERLTKVRTICGSLSGIIDIEQKQKITCKKCKSAMLDGF